MGGRKEALAKLLPSGWREYSMGQGEGGQGYCSWCVVGGGFVSALGGKERILLHRGTPQRCTFETSFFPHQIFWRKGPRREGETLGMHMPFGSKRHEFTVLSFLEL